jgi:hypothetical protein
MKSDDDATACDMPYVFSIHTLRYSYFQYIIHEPYSCRFLKKTRVCVANTFISAISQRKLGEVLQNNFTFYILVDTSEMNSNKIEQQYETYSVRCKIYCSRPSKCMGRKAAEDF